MLNISFLEPPKSLLFISQTYVGLSDHHRVYGPTSIQLEQFVKRTASVGRLTGSSPNVRAPRPIRRGCNLCAQPVIVSQGFCKHPFLNICTHDEVGAQKRRVHLSHGIPLLNRAVILPREVKDGAVIGGDNQRERVELPCPLALLQCLIEAATPHEMLRVPMVSGAVIGIQFDGPSEFPFGGSPVPVVLLNNQT